MRQGIAFFGCVALSLMASTSVHAQNAAIVNGKPITVQEVDLAFNHTSVARKAELTEEQRKLYRKHVLDILINDCLVNQYLDQSKVEVDPKKIDAHIADIRKQLQAKNRTLESFLAQMNIDETKMREDIRNIYRWLTFVESQASEKALRGYFDANKSAFDGSTVRASHILVKVDPSADAAAKQAARKKIEAIRAQLVGGTSFAEAARQFSDCPSSKEGGDLDHFPRKGVMSEPFAAAAFSLNRGQISEIVETEFGYHLILVTDIRPGEPVQYDQVHDQVKSSYSEELRSAVVARMRKSSDIKLVR